jgi:hypothetical protein
MFNIHPFLKLIISACSAKWDLQIYGLKTAKWEDQFSTYLWWRSYEFMISSALELQIQSYSLALKLCAKIIGWKHLDLLQFQASIAMFKLLICLNSSSIVQTNGWFLLRIALGSIIYKNLEELCDEKWNSKWEKNGGKMKIWIWNFVLLANEIRVWYLYGSLITMLIKLGLG